MSELIKRAIHHKLERKFFRDLQLKDKPYRLIFSAQFTSVNQSNRGINEQQIYYCLNKTIYDFLSLYDDPIVVREMNHSL
jgi:hypothetical protein